MRPIQSTIHLEALRHNLDVVRTHAPNSKVMAVVKANGYGHGLLNAAHGLSATDGFAVLGMNEAIDLREAGFTQKILLLEGVFSSNELNIAAGFGVSLVVHNFKQIELLETAILPRAVAVFIKINTGMNRLGFTALEFSKAMERLTACANVSKIRLMTHFANADDDEQQGIAKPLALFQQITQGYAYPTSLANSAAILRHPEAHADWVRPGIMLYGASPAINTSAAEFGLKPVMSLTSEIISVQNLEVGDSVGYGYRFTATQKMRVGVVACGYADGYPRHAGQYSGNASLHGTPIAVAGKLTQTLGRVSMDMLFADLTHIPDANIGSLVELWGAQIPVDDVAAACGTIGYELLCAVAQRVPVKVVE